LQLENADAFSSCSAQMNEAGFPGLVHEEIALHVIPRDPVPLRGF
jgi:hypothetical protein